MREAWVAAKGRSRRSATRRDGEARGGPTAHKDLGDDVHDHDRGPVPGGGIVWAGEGPGELGAAVPDSTREFCFDFSRRPVGVVATTWRGDQAGSWAPVDEQLALAEGVDPGGSRPGEPFPPGRLGAGDDPDDQPARPVNASRRLGAVGDAHRQVDIVKRAVPRFSRLSRGRRRPRFRGLWRAGSPRHRRRLGAGHSPSWRSARSAASANSRRRPAISLRRHDRPATTSEGGTSRRATFSSLGCHGSRSTRAHQRVW